MGLLTIAQSTRVCASLPVFLRAWTMAEKSTLCCFDPDLLDFVLNVLKETSKNGITEDNFQKSFHETESEEEASDEKRSDYNNSNDNNSEDGYFSAKNFVWSKTDPSKNFRTRIHNIFHVFADQLQRKNWEKKIVHKRLGLIICRSHVTSSSEKERKNCVGTE